VLSDGREETVEAIRKLFVVIDEFPIEVDGVIGVVFRFAGKGLYC